VKHMGVFFGHDGMPVPTPATPKTTTKVGCRITNGITINLEKHGQVRLNGPPMHGDVAFNANGVQTRAGNTDTHTFMGVQSMRGPHGETTITNDQWAEICRMHAASDWLVRGMVFKLAG
jgi:hypothetical protein